MQLVFVSNYYTHHQAPFSEELMKYKEIDYYFIQTETMPKERLDMGWALDIPGFVKFLQIDKELCEELIVKADVVIFGNAPDYLFSLRKNTKKITFVYSERIYKSGFSVLKYPIRFLKINKKYNHKNWYLLCAGAYTSYDFSLTGTLKGKAYKWGYFPAFFTHNNISELQDSKKKASILWAGRLISWKHPETALEAAKRLHEEGYNFSMEIIGTGELEKDIQAAIQDNKLEQIIQFTGPLSPKEVRAHMDKSDIFLFTSDYREGWGAVLNEAMNSGCCVVASHSIGSVPYLLNHKENGIIYEYEDSDDCYQKIKYLLDHENLRKEYGKKAYETLSETWNSSVAVERLVALSQSILEGNKHPILYKNGPLSQAEIIKNVPKNLQKED